MAGVVEFRGGKPSTPADPGHDAWLKRQAIQIAAQLPENRDDALAVLEYASQLVSEFLSTKRV